MAETTPTLRRNGNGLWPALWLALVLSGGVWLTVWSARQADDALRSRLLAQVTAVARSINLDAVAALSFEPSDKEKEHFRRLRSQMVAYARAILPRFGGQTKYLGIYSLARRGKDFFFGPESIDEQDRRASTPGARYEEAPAELARAFDSGLPQMVGPYTDEYGTYVSAFAPVLDPRSGRAVLVIGMDIEAAEWRAEVARRCVEPVGFTLALVLVVIGGGWWVRRARRQENEKQGWLERHAWALPVAVGGTLVSLWLARLAHQIETRQHQETFRRLAEAEIQHAREWLRDFRDSELEGLSRFIEGSQRVEPEEFLTYAAPLTKEPAVRAWGWVPVVPAEERISFEGLMRAAGLTNFAIWEKDSTGRRIPAAGRPQYYPVAFMEPRAGNEVEWGYDLASEPIRRKALEAAARTGLPTATEPVTLAHERGTQNALLAFRPVFASEQPKQLRGFAMAVVGLGDLLERIAGMGGMQQSSLASLELRWLTTNAGPILLASTMPAGMAEADPPSDTAPLALTAPLFAFGHTYAVGARPTPAFAELYPARAGLLAGLVGVGLTILLAALVDVISRRRVDLEMQVRQRTSELRASETRYRDLVLHLSEGVAIVDAAERFVFCNPAGEAIFGVAPGGLSGRTLADFTSPEQYARVLEQTKRRREGELSTYELEIRRPDGQARWLEITASPRTDDTGQFSGTLAIFRDITERRQAEAEKEKLQAQLTQAQKMESVGRLAGGVAHDFNNMLQAILGNTALALEDLPPESPVRDYLEEIQKCAQRSADLTRQLLAYARRQTIAPRALNLNEAIAGTLKMLRRLIGEDIELAWLPGRDLGLVHMDPSQVDQILANLCVNARDAIVGNGGKVTIETANVVFDQAYVAHHPEARAGQYVRLAVSDNGRGMPPEVKAHLFEPFFTTKGLGRGTGLGLATVYGIVKQNHGFITVYSEPGRGTTFQIHLPRYEVRAPESGREDSTPSPRRGHETILLVEDEAAILRMCQRSLENLGYTVLAASTPGEAMQLAREHAGEIHLLITDVVMPEMNGRELARNLLSRYPNLRRLFMSGYTANLIAHHGVLDPGVHFLQKPFSLQALAGKVREALGE